MEFMLQILMSAEGFYSAQRCSCFLMFSTRNSFLDNGRAKKINNNNNNKYLVQQFVHQWHVHPQGLLTQRSQLLVEQLSETQEQREQRQRRVGGFQGGRAQPQSGAAHVHETPTH